uniref:Ribosomal RNA small subunit methyltransferase A n=1 Tax=Chlorobium chlorochromatii (strain CaD3) TaxID=340177 RepID=RSMA_CHLCH|nr:RecName: Full=Ribosomal RNA small subunit methyltransferase A; AltName: Full=16S rRNA (adenine(1518)-N(6)/adenine(1519)-N(6))-dimethyltransferase; AltName: Full=16S rRNA dimethyladenosine transferase; AltName: Full=16S rRNA dimethylase; AltName: Full=S-adenosylmethionine-6-N', N'-adenosyl(rRNA) dimethyltransferase [Chlorobium chlorochromatii CaD3]
MINVEYKHTQVAAKKKLGQNFLTDRNITRKTVLLSGAKPDDQVVEIGPGFGALTRELVEECHNLTVIEKDPTLATFIRNEYPQIKVIEGDVLTINFSAMAQAGKPLQILGNIPYSITSPILFHLLEHRRAFRSATLMMQHEVALRLAAKPATKEYGILAVQMQAFCKVEYLFKVSRKVFKPQPKVESAVIKLTPHATDPALDADGFRRFVRIAFHQRRKTLLNNLKESYNLELVDSNKLQLRAEALSIEELLELFSLIKTKSE